MTDSGNHASAPGKGMPITPPAAKPISPPLMVLTVYGFEFLCYLAGRQAMPGWYESAIKPRYALHDWMFNLVWLLIFIPAAMLAVKAIGRRELKPLPTVFLYITAALPAITAALLFLPTNPSLTVGVPTGHSAAHIAVFFNPIPAFGFVTAIVSIGVAWALVHFTPSTRKRLALGAALPLVVWNVYAAFLIAGLTSLATNR